MITEEEEVAHALAELRLLGMGDSAELFSTLYVELKERRRENDALGRDVFQYAEKIRTLRDWTPKEALRLEEIEALQKPGSVRACTEKEPPTGREAIADAAHEDWAPEWRAIRESFYRPYERYERYLTADEKQLFDEARQKAGRKVK